MKYKDKNNGIHDPELPSIEAKAFLEKKSPSLMPFIEITDLEAETLLAPTAEEAEIKRVQDITAKANAYVLERYSGLKQHKYLSIVAALDDKELRQGLVLSADELAKLQEIRDCNTWITSVRDIENAAIADGVTLAENMVLPS